MTVVYQTVGTLADQGFIGGELGDLTAVGTMVFWVVTEGPSSSKLRVDEISGEPPGLILSDDALENYYRPQPIYFWDLAGQALVPDLRYVPLTITAPLRANRLLRWLVAGPSPWLGSSVQPLPQYVTSEAVPPDNDALVVKLTTQAAGDEPERLRRLKFQLQWSLRTSSTAPRVEFSIDEANRPVPASDSEHLQFNISNAYDHEPQLYDIVDQKVVVVPGGAAAPPVLTAPENIKRRIGRDRPWRRSRRVGARHR